MVPSKDLFNLIKTLSKAEKAYFKKYSRLHVRGENNNYVLLFDVIDRQNKYDEAVLVKMVGTHEHKNRFAVAKKYLYDQLLYALESYHHSIHSEVKSLLHRVEILYDKGLYEQSHKVLLKAKQIAKENEMYWAMLEIFRVWEINIAFMKHDATWIKNIITEKAKEIKSFQNTEAYRDMYFKIFIQYFTHGKTRTKRSIEEIEKIIRNRHMQNESTALTFESKLRFNNTYAIYWDAKGNATNVYTYAKKIIDLFHENPEKIPINYIYYLTQLGNVLVGAIDGKEYKEAEIYLVKMKETEHLAQTFTQKVRFFHFYYYLLLDYLNSTGQFAKAIDTIPSIIEELMEYENHLSEFDKIVLYSNIVIAFFGAGQYKSSILWLNRIRNEISLDVRKDIEDIMRIFYLIVHYETGNTDILPYLIQSVYRFLRKKVRLYKFETIIIHFLRNELPKTNTQKELIQVFQKLKTKLMPLEKDPFEKNAFKYFDLISWLDGKIQNRPFAEVVREKASQIKKSSS